MLRVAEALGLVLERARALPAVDLALEDSTGRRLAVEVRADADQPPFDKALVDGYAVRSSDLRSLPRSLRVGESIFAGQVPTRPLALGEAAEITTGAPLPPEADAVVMHEKTTRSGDSVEILAQEIRQGLNRLTRGRVYRRGDRLLVAGDAINPARLGLLGSVGAATVRVVDRPRVAVVPTGDELVEPSTTPGLGQIRNSNAAMLRALATRAGAEAWASPILPDEPDALREGLRRALAADVALVVGGVSAGSKDLVPASLKSLGVEEVFHKVRLKPGKPLWFGVGPARDGRPPTLVFGLPGNPLSGLVNFHLFVAPALGVLAGGPPRGPATVAARSATRLEHRSDLETWLPARIVEPAHPASGLVAIEPLGWSGSADLASAARADGFFVMPDREATIEPGEIVGFLPLD